MWSEGNVFAAFLNCFGFYYIRLTTRRIITVSANIFGANIFHYLQVCCSLVVLVLVFYSRDPLKRILTISFRVSYFFLNLNSTSFNYAFNINFTSLIPDCTNTGSWSTKSWLTKPLKVFVWKKICKKWKTIIRPL